MSPRIAIYPGTFDPITKGHVDILSRASHLFDEIIIGVATSARKAPLFDIKTRMQFCTSSIHALTNVRALPLNGMLVDFAKAHHATYIIRGIRSSEDMNYELSLATMNRQLSHDTCETIFLAAHESYAHISSTIVREIMSLKGDVSAFVPECVLREIKNHGA